jgi:hypothetical protein
MVYICRVGKLSDMRMTTFLLTDEDLELLRLLAVRRAQRERVRLSQGGTMRDLIRDAAAKAKITGEARRG